MSLERIVELRNQGKSWPEIGSELGLHPEAARGKYNRYRTSSLHKKDEEPPEQVPLPTVDDAIKQHNAELKDRQREKLIKELISKEAGMTRLIAAMREVVPQVPLVDVPVWPAPPQVGQGRPQSAVLLLSDIHYGELVRPNEIGGVNAYDKLIFEDRKRAYVGGVRSIIRHHQVAHPVRHLRIFDLGDGVDGDQIFRAQRLQQDLNLMEQVVQLAKHKVEIILSFLDLVDTITIEAVPGNHGRIGPKGDNLSYVNWDWIVAQMVSMQLAQYGERIKVIAPESFFHITETEGHPWLLWHGDDVKAWQGIPWYGIQRAIGNWIQIFNATGQRFEYAALGHFHTDAKVDITAGEIFVNGSWVGTNEFALRLRALGQPKQQLMFVHPRYGVTGRYPILLDRDGQSDALEAAA